jgi:hypothetical protein
MLCTQCQKTYVPGQATICSTCAAKAAPGASAGTGAAGSASSDPGMARRMVPTGNKPALLGYYAAIASAIPYAAISSSASWVGPALSVVAVVLGILGLVRARRHPEARGGGHAWFAIVGGIVLGWVGVSVIGWFRE